MRRIFVIVFCLLFTYGCIGLQTQSEQTGAQFHTYPAKAVPGDADLGLIADQNAANAIKTVTLNSLPISAATQTEINTKEDTLTNEAGLYSALSDVTNFMQPNITEVITVNWAIYDGTANNLTFNVPVLGADRTFNFPAGAPTANYLLGMNAGNTALEYKSVINVTLGGFTTDRAIYSDASGNLVPSAVTSTELELLDGEASSLMNDSDWIAATSLVAGKSELATAAEINTGTDEGRTITPDALAGSAYGTKEVAWTIHDTDTATAVADGKQLFIVPAIWSTAGLVLTDLTCRVGELNGATSGATTIIIRRVRTGSRMGDDTSQFDLSDQTGGVARVTYDGTGTDPGISTTTLSVGDYVDMLGWTDAANNGNFILTAVAANYFEYTNASLVADTDQTTLTITPVRHRDMTSTGTTVGYGDYTASDEVVDTANDDVAAGDGIFVDVTTVTTAAHNGLSVTAVFTKP